LPSDVFRHHLREQPRNGFEDIVQRFAANNVAYLAINRSIGFGPFHQTLKSG
jgi:hypothetical protein